LERGANIIPDIDGRFLGFNNKFTGAADAKAVVRGLGKAADFYGILVDDIFICLSITLCIINIPAENLKERVKKFPSSCVSLYCPEVYASRLRSNRSTSLMISCGADMDGPRTDSDSSLSFLELYQIVAFVCQ
jgi:hypothetical protein